MPRCKSCFWFPVGPGITASRRRWSRFVYAVVVHVLGHDTFAPVIGACHANLLPHAPSACANTRAKVRGDDGYRRS